MKKSSLGKRSSLSQQGSIIYSNNPVQKKGNEDSGARKSLLLKPGFTSKGNRSSSVDRDVTSNFIRREPLRRSKSALNIDVSHMKKQSSSDTKRPSTMNVTMSSASTPRQNGVLNFNGALSTGGNRKRVLFPTSESRRLSSMGEKTRKKESRPIGEKSFQIAAEEKVVTFFSRDEEGRAILSSGHIRPMNSNRFVEMLNYLVKIIDPRTVITKTNYAEDVAHLAKMLMYKGRMERSLIISVSAAHSWPYVLGFLLWLVELCMVTEAQNAFESMYPIDDQDIDADIDDINFRILIPHALDAFNAYSNGADDDYEINRCNMELKIADKITDEDMEQLEANYARLEKENYEMGELSGVQKLSGIKDTIEAVSSEIAQCKEFIKNGEEFLNELKEKDEEKDQEIKQLEPRVELLSRRAEELRFRIDGQKKSYNEKQQLTREVEDIKQEIECLNRCISEYTEMSLAEDLKMAAIRNKFESVRLAYNKQVIDNLPLLPRLKQTMINHNILHQNASENSEKIDEQLQSIESELRTKQVAVELAWKELKSDVENAKFELISAKNNLANLKHDREDVKLQLLTKQRAMEKYRDSWILSMSQLENKKRQLIESTPDVEGFRKRVNEAEAEFKELQQSYDTFARESIKLISERTEAVKKKNLSLQERKKNWTLENLVRRK